MNIFTRIKLFVWGCHKQHMGYTCRHETFDSGLKECGP